MARYIIERSVRKMTQTGKPFLKTTLKDERGDRVEDVIIWQDYPLFERLTPGAETTGTVETNERGFRSLKPMRYTVELRQSSPQDRVQSEPRRSASSAGDGDPRANAIRVAQARKNESIAYFNSVNSAIALVAGLRTKLVSSTNRTALKSEIEYWRDWFLGQWNMHESTIGSGNPIPAQKQETVDESSDPDISA